MAIKSALARVAVKELNVKDPVLQKALGRPSDSRPLTLVRGIRHDARSNKARAGSAAILQSRAGDIPIRNGILAALLDTECKRLLPKLEHVSLKAGEIIYRADQQIEAVYFPEEAVVAMVDSTSDRRTVEVGIIGHEGLVGINIFLGGVVTPDKAIVQLPGGAMRMKSQDLRQEVRFGGLLQRLLLQYTRTFLAVISQSVACSQHHNVDQRLARWLLTMSDYARERTFVMAQQSIAAMLGVRRVSVTNAASKFESADLISNHRGHIRVLDKRGLRKRSCDCYGFIRQQYGSRHDELPGLLSRK